LDVFDQFSGKEVKRILTLIKLRCHEKVTGLTKDFTLTGGSLKTQWYVKDFSSNPSIGSGALIGSPRTISLSANSNVLQSSGGGGITLAFRNLEASAIDNVLTPRTTDLNYLVKIEQLITANLEFKFVPCNNSGCTISGLPQVQTKTVVLVAQVGSGEKVFFRIVNENPEPPTPTSNVVSIASLNTIPNPMFDNNASPKFNIRIALPDRQTGENPPLIDVFKPNGFVFLSNLPIPTFSPLTQQYVGTIDIRIGDLFAGNYIVKAHHSTRTGEDLKPFAVYQSGSNVEEPVDTCKDLSEAQCQKLISEEEDPCKGLTGTLLNQCLGIVEEFTGCANGFTAKTQKEFIEIASIVGPSGNNVVIQSGFTTTEDPICVLNETIATFEAIRSGSDAGACKNGDFSVCAGDPIFNSGNACFGLTLDQCFSKCNSNPESCGLGTTETTGVEDKITATIIKGDISSIVNPVILYQIVFDGSDEIGIIDTAEQIVDFSALEFAAIPAGEKEFYEFKRIIVIPAIDITDATARITSAQSAPDFTYLWSASIEKSDGTKKDAILETCDNRCLILDMNTVGVQIQSNILAVQLGPGDENVEKTYYQIARSDIQPNELDRVFANAFPNIILEKGDLVTFKVIINGSYTLTIDGVKVQAVVSPMEWSRTFTWIPEFGDDFEPCAKLTGQAQLDCLGNPIGKSLACKDLTANQCNMELRALDADGCAFETINGVSVRLCYGEDDAGSDAGSFGGVDTKVDTKGNVDDEGLIFGTCPEGTTATECADLLLEVLEQRLAGILGISGSTITAISNNAVLIIASIIVILVIAVIARTALRRRLRRSGL